LNIILEQISSRQFFKLRKNYEHFRAKYERREIKKSFKQTSPHPFLPKQMIVNDLAITSAQDIVYNNNQESFQQILINNLYQRFYKQPSSTQTLLLQYCSAPKDLYNGDYKDRNQPLLEIWNDAINLLSNEHYNYLDSVSSGQILDNKIGWQQIDSWREILTGNLAEFRLNEIVKNKFPERSIAEIDFRNITNNAITRLVRPITKLVNNSPNKMHLKKSDLASGLLHQVIYDIYQTTFLNSSIAPEHWQSIYFDLLTKSNKELKADRQKRISKQ
jgi:hypothetical protein